MEGSERRVLVLPGLGASDGSTLAIRTALSARGFRVHGWRLGRNLGPSEELVGALRSRFFELVDRSAGSIALVGWSMGGLYAHRLAELAPDRVRCVVTLGSPLGRGEHRGASAASPPGIRPGQHPRHH